MQIWITVALVWFVVVGVSGGAILMGFWDAFSEKIPQDQPIATTCYVNDKVKELQTREVSEQPIGYYYEKDGTKKEVYDKVDETDTQIKVKVNSITPSIVYVDSSYRFDYYDYKWIPKQDFYKYYTAQELSELYNQQKSK